MSYCLAILIDDGIVFCADSRTNAGPDRVGTHKKMHVFSREDDRTLVLLVAGNLATSQAVIARIKRDVRENVETNVYSMKHLSDIADYIGQLVLAETSKFLSNEQAISAFDASVTFILGGQISGQKPGLHMIYPEGNHIKPSKDQPYLQIGEVKYGKPILDRIIKSDTPYETAMRCAVVSVDSTMRSNVTVGPPIECLFYRKDSLVSHEQYFKLDESHSYLSAVRESWEENIRVAFERLPSLDQVFAEHE